MNIRYVNTAGWSGMNSMCGFRFAEDALEVMEDIIVCYSGFGMRYHVATVEHVSENECIVECLLIKFSHHDPSSYRVCNREKHTVRYDPIKKVFQRTTVHTPEGWWGDDVLTHYALLDGPHNDNPSRSEVFAPIYHGTNICVLADETLYVNHKNMGWIPYTLTKGKGLFPGAKEELRMFKNLIK